MNVRRMSKDEQPDWLVRSGAGIERGDTIVGVFDGTRFAVVKFPGHSYWSGIGMHSYAKTEYSLLEKGKSIMDAKKMHEGRATLRDLGRMQLALEAAERRGSL